MKAEMGNVLLKKSGINSLIKSFVILSVSALTLTGCLAFSSEPTITITEAKAVIIAQQEEVVSLMPSDIILSTNIKQKSSLSVECKHGGRSWIGSTEIEVSVIPDKEEFVSIIKEEWDKKEGWTNTISRDSEGDPVLSLNKKDGTSLFITLSSVNKTIDIRAWSACSTIPDGYSYGTEY